MNCPLFASSFVALALWSPWSQSASANPDFSGTWELDPKRSVSAHSSDPRPSLVLVIKQTPAEVSIETRQGGQSETIVYRLDGSETEKPAQDNGPFQWRARWKGTQLVTETHRNVNRSTVTITEMLSLDTKTKELTIDRTLTVQHGYSMRGAKNYSSGKDVFVRSR
jgi:hypothetical protein